MPTVLLLVGLFIVFAGRFAIAGTSPDLDTDGDGLTDAEERGLKTSATNPDTDGDGLLDSWEVRGYEVGGHFEPLHHYGADPLVRDVFVEVDWMGPPDGEDDSIGPLHVYQAAVDIVRAFEASGTGIRIHFDLGVDIVTRIPADAVEKGFEFSGFTVQPDPRKELPYQDSFPGRPRFTVSSAGSRSSQLSLYDVYNDPRYFRTSRRNIFYYVVCASQRGASGERGGNFADEYHPFVDEFSDLTARRDGLRDAGVHAGVFFLRPVPSYDDSRRLRYHYSVSLLHELGHAFGFGHGGALARNRWDNTNYKVNYPSIMNYRYQFFGVDMADGVPVMDFSHGGLSAVTELELFEPTGLGMFLNDHLLTAASVGRVAGTPFPNNLDWNNDGLVTSEIVRRDLNQNGVIDVDVRRDHDDWGKLMRDGFEGIGVQAYDGCGPVCSSGNTVQRVFGDFDGDGSTDVFLHNGQRAAWAVAIGGRRPFLELADRVEALDDWAFEIDDRFFTGDFLGEGSDTLLWHRGDALGVVDLNQGDARLRVRAEGVVAAASAGIAPWTIRPTDALFPARLVDGSTQIVASNGSEVAVLTVVRSAAERDDFALVTAWRVSLVFAMGPGIRAPIVASGRRFADGTESFFVRGSTFSEIRVDAGGFNVEGLPETAPRVQRLDVDGLVVPEDAGGASWALSPRDTHMSVDLDGDGADELVLLGTGRLGVARWQENSMRLAWSAEDDIGGRGFTAEWDHLVSGQFIRGAGKELVLSSGNAWLTLAWDVERETVRVLSASVGSLDFDGSPLATPPFELHRGQRLLVGRFTGDEIDEILVVDGADLVLASFDNQGFQQGFGVIDQLPRRVGDWPLHVSDQLTAVQGDQDPQLELVAFKGELFGVFDSNSGAASFVRKVDPDSLLLRAAPGFRRGDVNSDSFVDISDASRLLTFLFLGGSAPDCADAADADDSGDLDLADVIYLLSFLFLDRSDPPEPGPDRVGLDPSPDSLPCG